MKYFFRLLIPVVFFAFVFSMIDILDIIKVFYTADWIWFGIGCGCVVLGNYLSSMRTRELLYDRSQPFLTLWHIHALRALITGALPFSTGELSYVYYLKKYCVTPATDGLAMLVSMRFLEFFMFLCLLFLVAIYGVFMEGSRLNQMALGIIGINLALVFFAVWKAAYIKKALIFIRDLFPGTWGNKEFSSRISQKAELFSRAVKKVVASDKKARLMIMTFSIVILKNIFVLCMIRAMGVTISVWFIIYLFIFLFVTRFFQGFGSFGNQEAGISGALILMGYPKTEALALAIGTHLLQWVPVLLIGVVSYIGLHRSN